jgi:hypothetical protein
MSDPVEVVREHLAAVAGYDWDRVKTSMSANADLTLSGVADWEWTIFTLYRNVTQAWDFTVADTQLNVKSDGVVAGVIRLVNHGWVKDVACKYHVTEDRIIAVTLSDAAPVKASMLTD